jgi:hypothetical protein
MVAVGVLCGAQRPLLATVVAGYVLFLFELPYIPGLRLVDPRRFQALFRTDEDVPEPYHRPPKEPGVTKSG